MLLWLWDAQADLTHLCLSSSRRICMQKSVCPPRPPFWMSVEKMQVSRLHLRRTDSSVSSAARFDAALEVKSTLDENEVHCLSALPLLED